MPSTEKFVTRLDAISSIMDSVTDEVVICSTGMICREVYQVRDRVRNFYMMGSMSAALAIGIGLAHSRPDIKVIVISGDGAVLMSLGTCVLQNALMLPNLYHYILDNNTYSSTGGQATCSYAIDFESLSDNTEVIKCIDSGHTAPRIPLSCNEIRRRVHESICLGN